jgi:hypothetical protein
MSPQLEPDEPTDASPEEAEVLLEFNEALGKLLSCGIRRLGRDVGIRTAQEIEQRHLSVQYSAEIPDAGSMTVRMELKRGADIGYSFEWNCDRPRFVGAEVSKAN